MKKKTVILIILGILGILIGSFFVIHSFYLDQKVKQEDVEEIDNFFETFTDNEEENLNENSETQVSKTKAEISTNYIAVIEIPKINLKTGVVWSNKSFSTMNRNVSIYPTSVLPDKVGNLILFAHSGTTRVGYFHNINKLQEKDPIYLYYNHQTYIYKVVEIWEVSAANYTKEEITKKEL